MFNRKGSSFFNTQSSIDNAPDLPLPELPRELWDDIASRLDPATIAKGLSRTSREFHAISTSDFIFKQKLRQHFSLEHPENHYSFFADTYKNQYKYMSLNVKTWHSLLKEGDIDRIKLLKLNIEDILPSLRKYNEGCLFKTMQQRQYIRDFLFERVYEYFKEDLHASKHGYTLLHYIGMLGPSYDLISALLPGFDLQAATPDKDRKAPLFHAVERNLTDTCNTLLNYSAPHNETGNNTHHGSLIYYAARNGLSSYLELLHKKGVTEVDAPRIRDEFTPLYIACQQGQLRSAEILLDMGADPNARCNSGSTPMYIAAQEGHAEIIKLLAERGGRQSINQLGFRDGFSPLYVASRNGHVEAVALLIELGAEINANDGDGSTPLYVACQNGHINVARLLLKAGAQVDSFFLGGYTPLYIAAQNGHHPIINLLTQYKAQLDRLSPNGSTALYVASQNGHDQVATVLLSAGASVDITYSKGYSPLYVASQKGHLEVVKVLLPVIEDINHQTDRGATAIYVASQRDRKKIVNFLLENKADPAVQFENGYTALHIACGENNVAIAKMLAKACPALLDMKDKDGKTAVDILNQHPTEKRRELIKYFKEIEKNLPGKLKRERENDEVDASTVSEPKKFRK